MDFIGEHKTLFRIAGIAALLAMAANLLDIVISFGETELVLSGDRNATDWYYLIQDNGFRGLYLLGVLNIVYMFCMIPVYLALLAVHQKKQLYHSLITVVLFLIALAIYVSNHAAIPMAVLSDKFAAASIEEQKILLSAAGEAVLARGEDFTPGAFPGMILSSIAALMISIVMLRGDIFSRFNSWLGIVGFTFLSIFTILATFYQTMYVIAYYFFGMIGGLLVLTWFLLTALRFFKLARTDEII